MTRFVDIVFSNLVLGCFSRFSPVQCCAYRRVALKGGHSPSHLGSFIFSLSTLVCSSEKLVDTNISATEIQTHFDVDENVFVNNSFEH